ncbi:MAG: poly-gamma-glutamate hydrolase family protein [Deltaproteobacteria bacterium]|nr:poly-gamma-glutamate hydrolase family protein [Deltaproteobacteria bacterium]
MILQLLLSGLSLALAAGADFYKNYDELSKAEREGVDYRVVVHQRRAPLTVLAIHGGDIEIGTSDFAQAIAGEDSSLYLFEGIKHTGNSKLHITSTHFDEPRALAMAAGSRGCLSIHGFLETVRSVVCVGGGNPVMRKKMTDQLTAATGLGIEVESPCQRFGGDDAKNIVNRCQNPGVQLETSTALRRRFDRDPALRLELARIIRKAMVD